MDLLLCSFKVGFGRVVESSCADTRSVGRSHEILVLGWDWEIVRCVADPAGESSVPQGLSVDTRFRC